MLLCINLPCQTFSFHAAWLGGRRPCSGVVTPQIYAIGTKPEHTVGPVQRLLLDLGDGFIIDCLSTGSDFKAAGSFFPDLCQLLFISSAEFIHTRPSGKNTQPLLHIDDYDLGKLSYGGLTQQ